MLPAKPFYMIRHGQTEANLAGILQGQSESPLTALGIEQARGVQPVLRVLDIKPSVIVHSPLSRARDTAVILNEVLNLPLYEEPGVAEKDLGDWVGRSYGECGDALASHSSPPNGETPDAFFSRVQQGLKAILKTYDSPPLIVSHGGVFQALGGIYGLSGVGVMQNCCLYEFQPAPKKAPFPWDVSSYETHPRVTRVRDALYDNCTITGDG